MSFSEMLAQILLEGSFQGRDAKIFQVLGKRTAFQDTTGLYDMNEYMAAGTKLFTELAGTETWEVLSSDAADAAAGTGTRTVKVTYIDTSYALASKTVTMNGVTPVAVTGMAALMILGMEAKTGGSAEVGAGNIDLRTVSGSVVHERIAAGGNKSLSARFMVPDGYEALIPRWDTHVSGQNFDFRLRATVDTYTKALGTRYIFQDTALMPANSEGEHTTPWIYLPARCKVKISVNPISVAGTPRADCSFPIVLIAG